MSAARDVSSYLAQLIAIESTPGREERIVKRACQEMRALGYRGVHVDAAGNAVGRTGSGAPIVLVDCHLDTVPLHAPDAWTRDPFGAEISGGRMHGLGACDMKGSVAAATYGLAALHPRPPGTGTVVLVCSIAEETMEGAALREAVESVQPDVVVIGEPTDLAVHRGHRGRGKLDVTVHGRGAHVANRRAGINAVGGMANLIAAIAAAQNDEHGHALALECLDVRSEPQPSVSMLPHLCHAHIDCRFASTVDPTTIPARFDRILETSMTPGPWTIERTWHCARFVTYNGRRFAIPELVPSWELPEDHPVLRAALDGVSRAGITPRTGTYGFCTNGGMTAGELGIPTIGFGVGRESEAHTVDEWVSLADLRRAVHGFAAIANALLETPVIALAASLPT